MSIKSKIQSLIAAANAKTGETDTTLTDAVQTLCDGYGRYGQGGGGSGLPSGVNGVYYGTYTPLEDVNEFVITHGLGRTPILAAAWIASPNESPETSLTSVGACAVLVPTELDVIASSSGPNVKLYNAISQWTIGSTVGRAAGLTLSRLITMPDSSTVTFRAGTDSQYWAAGQELKILIVA